jgi:hypothetical protein
MDKGAGTELGRAGTGPGRAGAGKEEQGRGKTLHYVMSAYPTPVGAQRTYMSGS